MPVYTPGSADGRAERNSSLDYCCRHSCSAVVLRSRVLSIWSLIHQLLSTLFSDFSSNYSSIDIDARSSRATLIADANELMRRPAHQQSTNEGKCDNDDLSFSPSPVPFQSYSNGSSSAENDRVAHANPREQTRTYSRDHRVRPIAGVLLYISNR